METIWIIIVLALLIIALLGAFIPVLPSITVGWVGILILYLVSDDAVSGNTMLWVTLAAIGVKALDILLPLWGVKVFGGTKKGDNSHRLGLHTVHPALPWFFSHNSIPDNRRVRR